MFPLAHFLTGYAVGAVLVATGLVQPTSVNLVLFGLVSLLPDLDAVWHRQLATHHQTWFHAPLFWVVVASGLAVVDGPLAVAVASITLVHLGTDYVAGRTIGVPVLAPLDWTEYSLYPLSKETAGLDPVRPGGALLRHHVSYYLENRVLVAFELGLTVAGLVGLVVLLV